MLVAKGQQLISQALASIKARQVDAPEEDDILFDNQEALLQVDEVAHQLDDQEAVLETAVHESGKRKRAKRAGPKRITPYFVYFGARMKTIDRSNYEKFQDVVTAIANEWKSLDEDAKKVRSPLNLAGSVDFSLSLFRIDLSSISFRSFYLYVCPLIHSLLLR